MKIKNSPYNLRETLGYFKRNFLGPVAKNRGLVRYCRQCCQLNPGIQPQYKIAFIGDVMDMKGRRLRTGTRIKQFIASCDYLVGNFEATITNARGAYLAQRHSPQILNALAELFPSDKTFLGLANNHSGDFGLEIWSESKMQIEERGFSTFGTSNATFVEIDNAIRIVGATQWSNQPVDYIRKIEKAHEFHQPGLFNILYPHWGYEMELYPRPETIERGRQFSLLFDAIVGHHSHIPQPVTEISLSKSGANVKQLVAYSLGDFCIHEKLKHYHFGQVIIMSIGPDSKGKLKTGSLEWRFTRCRRVSDDLWETDITSDYPYPTA